MISTTTFVHMPCEQGMDEATVNTIVDPTAIKILHKARLFDQGKAGGDQEEESRCQEEGS